MKVKKTNNKPEALLIGEVRAHRVPALQGIARGTPQLAASGPGGPGCRQPCDRMREKGSQAILVGLCLQRPPWDSCSDTQDSSQKAPDGRGPPHILLTEKFRGRSPACARLFLSRLLHGPRSQVRLYLLVLRPVDLAQKPGQDFRGMPGSHLHAEPLPTTPPPHQGPRGTVRLPGLTVPTHLSPS